MAMRAARYTFQALRLQSTVSASGNASVAASGEKIAGKVTLEGPMESAPAPVPEARNRAFASVRVPVAVPYHKDPLQAHYVPQLEATRLVPTLRAFYARNPFHEEHMARLQALLNANATLPFDRRTSSEVTWIKFNEYREKAGGDALKETEYLDLVRVLKRLDAINVELRSEELTRTLEEYSRSGAGLKDSRKEKTLDDKGRAIAVGRRKSSSAKVYLVRGEGKVLVNGESVEEVFPKLQDRLKLLYPMELVGQEGQYNVFGLVRGGGSTGQVDALRLAISKALCVHNPLFKQKLSGAGCLHRDPRRVERKKPGKKGARKMPTWVKR